MSTLAETQPVRADTERLDWLETHPFAAYRDRDPGTGMMYDHFTLVAEDARPRIGIVNQSLRAAIDIAMGRRNA